LTPVLISGQTETGDTVVQLSQVQVTASRLNTFSTGLKIITFDSLTLSALQFSNLDEIISRETPLYIKSYGQGSLATIAFRGTAATHTGIYWNGIPLNPSTSALFDLSLAPVAYFNSIRILEGGSGTLFGSGNIGGSIHLNNEPVFSKGLIVHAGLSVGSFDDYGQTVRIISSGKKIFSSTVMLYRISENNFPYKNLYDEEVRQQNAAYRHYGLMQDFYWKPNLKWLMGASLWLQSGYREIPATQVTGESIATQEDKCARVMVTLKNFYSKGSSSIKLAFIHDSLRYQNPASIIESDRDSKISTNRMVAELQTDRRLWINSVISTGGCLTREVAISNNFGGNISQNWLGFFISMLQVFPALKWKANLNLRQDLTEGYRIPLTPSLGLEGTIWKTISGKINISRNFRIPSFNELYWIPYGNKSLNPEKSWNGEVSLAFKSASVMQLMSSELIATVFNSVVTDWIIWIPEGSVWSPQNIARVWSRGLELNGAFTLTLNRFTIKLSEGYTLAKSTNQKKVYANDNSFEKQLIYVPEHRLFCNLNLHYRSFYFNYNLTYTGIRFTTSDNNSSLPGFSLSNLTLGKEIRISKCAIGIQLDVNNLFNKNYQAILYYPMPGRSYNVSVNFKFNSK
jgi:iron complex outermembrane receptor protein